jgi:dienelactone hydrolase
MAETLKTAVAVVGIDIGKNSFHIVGQDRRGAIVLRQRVRTQPKVDPGRVYAIGWSFGGGALLSALSRLEAGDLTLTKAVAISPLCQGAKPWLAATPLLLLLGALDDVAPPNYCNVVISESPPGKVTSFLFPNARHGFDIRSLPESLPYSSGGTLGYNQQADLAAKGEIAKFLR